MEMRGAFTFAIVPAFGEGGGGGSWKYQGFVLFRQKRQCNENLADCEVGGTALVLPADCLRNVSVMAGD